MSKFKKVLFLVIAMIMVLSVFTACGGDKEEGTSKAGVSDTVSKEEATTKPGASEEADADVGTESEDDTTESDASSVPEGEAGSYTITLATAGGLALSGIDVLVYEDSSLSDLVQFGQTDENGTVSLKISDDTADMAITFAGLPEGYVTEEYYSFSGAKTDITVTSSVVSDKSLSDTVMELGDVMYDFSVTTVDGETLTLSEILSEKKLVLLNFWYTTCSWCLTEFPVMNEVYQQYSDDVAVIALDPLDGATAVKMFAQDYNYSFYMADCPASWANTFGITGYPTSVFIDRYGVVCLIEAGAITTNRPFVAAFEHFTAEDYKQQLCESVGELVTEVKPTVEFEGSETVANAINSGDIEVTYRPETEDENWEYSWPFVTTEKDGETCVYATNKGFEDSFAILYADVTLKAGQAVGFDYIASSEKYSDILYVIVNDDDIYQISGNEETQEWKTCYPWVADEDGVYELALCYLKDSDTNEGDDTVYIKNMRVVEQEDIDVATYIPRKAAVLTDDGLTYEYAEIFFNETDGYYHVGSADGPLLLADLMNLTELNEEKTLWDILYDGDIMVDGKSYYDNMVDYFSYASNSSLQGICTVDSKLAEHLGVVSDAIGFDGTENEWLKACMYYQVYGSDGTQLTDPIQGVATFSATEAVLGVDKEENFFYYDRAIMPRGMFKKFVPATSGAYRITSHNESLNGVDGWIFNSDREELYTYGGGERTFVEEGEVSMVFYMEAGKEYFINIAFWDLYETGYIYFDVEYLGASFDLFEAASPGYFTYDTDATGSEMHYTISGGITPILKDDGYYYHDLGLDENGNQIYGSMIYADFTGVTAVFDKPITDVNVYDDNGNIVTDDNGAPVMINGMITMGGFDFSKTEDDLYILGFLKANDNDVDATLEYLKKMWGDSYDDYAETYQIDDVLAGKYHGKGEDLSEEISEYISKIIKDGSVKDGCVPVDEELASILQLLMDKYTFEGVEYSWLKVCYYYNYLGA